MYWMYSFNSADIFLVGEQSRRVEGKQMVINQSTKSISWLSNRNEDDSSRTR